VEAGSFYVYVLAGRIGGTLYIGVTNDLIRSVAEHRLKLCFTKQYEIARLVRFEHSMISKTRSSAKNG
jgi:putative endonuclease